VLTKAVEKGLSVTFRAVGMSPRFYIGQTVFNRNTKERGTIQSIHGFDGILTYEVSIPFDRGYLMGSNHSDWAENALEAELN